MPAPLPPSRTVAPTSPMSSPQHLANANAQSPPPFPRRQSRLHLPTSQAEPPIPPRLVGSPLLNNLISANTSASAKQTTNGNGGNGNGSNGRQEAWIDGDEFGMHRHRTADVPRRMLASYASSRGVPA